MAKTSNRAMHARILLLLAATGMTVAILSLSPSPAGSQAFRCGLADASPLGLATGHTWDFGSQACIEAEGTCSNGDFAASPPRRRAPMVPLPVSVATVQQALPEPAPARPCGRVTLTQRLGWICAASWAACPAKLVVSTVARPFLVAPDGRVTPFARTAFGSEGDGLPPSSIEPLNGNLLISFSNRRAVLLDPSLKEQVAAGTLSGPAGREAALGQLTNSALFHERHKADEAISRAEQADRRSLATAVQMRALTAKLAERNKITDAVFAQMFGYVCTAEHGTFDFASRTCLLPDGRSLAYPPPSQ